MLVNLLFFILGLAAAAGVFLVFINRILSYLRSPVYKRMIIPVAMIVLTLFFSALAWFGGWLGHALILLVLGGLALHELLFRGQIHRLRGAAPVSRVGEPFALSHPVTTTDLTVFRYAVRLPRRSGEAPDGPQPPVLAAEAQQKPRLRVAHISDLHLNDHLPQSFYDQMADAVVAARPDLLFITGDFVSEVHGIRKFPALAERMTARLGCFAIFGNHDYWAGPHEVAAGVRATGVELIGNGHRRVKDGDLELLILGCEEPWSPDKMTPPERRPREALLVLSHSADQIYRLSKLGAAAVFSGHYHAGQFQIPYFGPLFIPSRFGRRFHHGHYVVGGTHLFVSAGMGAAHPPLRLYCPPDVFIVDFY